MNTDVPAWYRTLGNEEPGKKLPNPNPINRVWFDDIVVSTEYVGPIQRRTQ